LGQESIGTDGCNGREGWYVDNVQVCTCENSILPVELTNFSAKALESSILLDWETANERNNAGFFVERSLYANRDFVEIAWVEGANNSSQRQNYTYDDKETIPGLTYYYRLRQVDFDGTENSSPIVNAKIETANDWDVVLFPNPARDELSLQAIGEGNEVLDIVIIGVNGQVVRRFAKTDSILNISDLATGLYWVKMTSSRGTLFKKLFVE